MRVDCRNEGTSFRTGYSNRSGISESRRSKVLFWTAFLCCIELHFVQLYSTELYFVHYNIYVLYNVLSHYSDIVALCTQQSIVTTMVFSNNEFF